MCGTLKKYSNFTTSKSGFNPYIIQRLVAESDLENLAPHEKHVSLLFDEMKIKSDLVYQR